MKATHASVIIGLTWNDMSGQINQLKSVPNIALGERVIKEHKEDIDVFRGEHPEYEPAPVFVKRIEHLKTRLWYPIVNKRTH